MERQSREPLQGAGPAPMDGWHQALTARRAAAFLTCRGKRATCCKWTSPGRAGPPGGCAPRGAPPWPPVRPSHAAHALQVDPLRRRQRRGRAAPRRTAHAMARGLQEVGLPRPAEPPGRGLGDTGERLPMEKVPGACIMRLSVISPPRRITPGKRRAAFPRPLSAAGTRLSPTPAIRAHAVARPRLVAPAGGISGQGLQRKRTAPGRAKARPRAARTPRELATLARGKPVPGARYDGPAPPARSRAKHQAAQLGLGFALPSLRPSPPARVGRGGTQGV